jgi:hypothetical protein
LEPKPEAGTTTQGPSQPVRERLAWTGDAPEVTLRVIPQVPELTPDPVEVRVKGPILPGPVGAHLSVFDYSRDADVLYAAASPRRDGSFPDYDIEDYRFHQLNAYAVATRAISLVESELGRTLGWGFDASRLILLPHAGYLANAFYSEDTQSLQFYSFQREDRSIYHTSLVHDIVAHETGHALLDAVRDRYTEANEPETAALHEAVGDLTAVFAALSHEVVRSAFLAEGGPDLRQATYLPRIADDFGRGGAAGAISLRDLAVLHPPSFYDGVTEPHDLSLKLTTGMWEALVRMFAANRAAGGEPDDALALARRALQRMTVRGLDYLPPADATFEDFARAMLRADVFANPGDDKGYRRLVATALADCGVVATAQDVLDESPASRPWSGRPPAWPRLTATEAYVFLDGHRRRLALSTFPEYRDFVVRDFHVTSKPPSHTEIDEVIFVYEHPLDVELIGPRFGSLRGKWITIWGGGTLVFDTDGRLRHHARKVVTAERIDRALAFLAGTRRTSRVTEIHSTVDDQLRAEAARRPFLALVSADGVQLRTNPAARCASGSPVALVDR